jgi:hypothetical protein
MKKIIILFLFFTFYSFIPGTRDCFPQSQFQVVIGDSSNSEEARSIIQTTDGGYIAVGETGINGDMYIVKLNSSGQLQWSKTIGGSGQDIAISVVQTTDGGFAVSGFGNSFGTGVAGAFIVKLTPGGTVEWARVLADGFLDAAYSIIQTMDGGYAAAISPGEGGFTPDRMIIVKLNSMGILQWSKRIAGNSYARCIRQTTDKGYIVAGGNRSFENDMFVVKLDSNGSLQWAKTIGGTGDEFAYSIVQTTDGGYAVAGRTGSFGNADKMYIAKLDSSGMLQWTKVVAVNFDRAYSIVQTADGGYAVAGGGMAGMLIVKLNPDGSLQWSRVVKAGSVPTYAYSIVETTDGGYAAAGYGGILGAIGMFIVKLDNNGNTCGNTVSHNVSIDSGGILGSPVPTVTNISLLDTSVTPPTGSRGYVTPICVIGIQPISNEIPASYKLYQNYPNPFNPATKIKFDITGTLMSSECSLRVYDMLGKEIAVLVNQRLQPGTYQVEWDGTNYASGVYYYKLSILNSGSSVKHQETKRMVLIK